MTWVSCMVLVTLATTRPSDAKDTVPRVTRMKIARRSPKFAHVKNERAQKELEKTVGNVRM